MRKEERCFECGKVLKFALHHHAVDICDRCKKRCNDALAGFMTSRR